MDSLIVHCLSLGQDVYVKTVLWDTLNLLPNFSLNFAQGVTVERTKQKIPPAIPSRRISTPTLPGLTVGGLCMVGQGGLGWQSYLVRWTDYLRYPTGLAKLPGPACPAIREYLPAWPVWLGLKSALHPWAADGFSPTPPAFNSPSSSPWYRCPSMTFSWFPLVLKQTCTTHHIFHTVYTTAWQ